MTWDTDGQAVQVAWVRVGTLLPLLAVILTVATLRSHDVRGSGLLIGLAGLTMASLPSITRAYRRFDQTTMPAMGLLDLVAVLAVGSLPGTPAAGALVVVQGVWLGGVFRWRGVAACAVTGVAALGLMRVLDGPDEFAALRQLFWIVTVAVVAATTMAAIISVWVAQVERLESHRAALATALSALEAEQERAAAIVHTVDVGLATVQPDGSFTALNPRFTEIMALAFPTGHPGGTGQVGEIYGADNRTRIEQSRLPSVRALGGEPFTDTVWVGDQQATRRALAVSGRPIVDGEGVFTGAVIAYHDVTTVMRALRVKDDFVAMVSHELRTPLTSIIGNLELIAELDGDAEQRSRLLAVASRNADRLLHLISDLLTASHTGQRGMPLVPDAVDLSQLLAESVDDVADRAQTRAVGLTTEIGPGLRVVGDRGRLLQVTENLLSNAVKYTPAGGHVRVTLRQVEADTVLTVQDTGIGVSESDQKDVFTKFFRGRNAEELALPGVGLGLAITKEIVVAHGGSIRLTSDEGHGTTVLVTLPSRLWLN